MTRWRSIKNDMVVFFFEGVIGQQPSELIKCGYLRRTRARQLFFNAFDNSIRQHSTYRPNDSVSIDLRRGLRVDFQCKQPRYRWNCSDCITDVDAEDLSYVGCGVCTY